MPDMQDDSFLDEMDDDQREDFLKDMDKSEETEEDDMM